MCGIVGYVGNRPALPILLDCLGRLEYRGYDSCGVAVHSGGPVLMRRAVGAVRALEELLADRSSNGTIGVAHTRWATQGRPEIRNTHPLASCDGSILVVHNGIIENAALMRDELVASGHRFASETDSEVIPHFLEERVDEGESLEGALVDATQALQGSFAVLVCPVGSEYLLAVRRGSPLVIGVGDGEHFPASDIPSILPYTHQAIWLNEDECVRVSPDRVVASRRDAVGSIRQRTLRPTHLLPTAPTPLVRGPFAHFMVKEIHEQAEGVRRLLGRSLLRSLAESVRGGRQLFLLGAGTSYHAALYGEYLLGQSGLPGARAVVASEFPAYTELIDERTLILALSQSGETADTLEAVKLARSRGARIGAITNTIPSSLSLAASVVVDQRSGPELAVPATKSYTSQLTLLHSLARQLSADGRPPERELERAADLMVQGTAASVRRPIQRIAARMSSAPYIVLLGRGLQYVSALEGALKLKETAGVWAGGFPAGELKHGPLALVEEGSPALLLYDRNGVSHAEATAGELAARGAEVCTIGAAPLRSSKDHIQVEDAGQATPLVQIVPLQLLAYELARLRGLDPDRPRNLAKSVTVV